jgi:TolB-like protein
MKTVTQKHGFDVGDLIRHKHGTLQGTGLVIAVQPFEHLQQNVTAIWTAHGVTKEMNVAARYMEVIL